MFEEIRIKLYHNVPQWSQVNFEPEEFVGQCKGCLKTLVITLTSPTRLITYYVVIQSDKCPVIELYYLQSRETFRAVHAYKNGKDDDRDIVAQALCSKVTSFM